MAVYVDNARIPFRGWLMCHMFADSLDELHAMAQRLGLKRSWFQRGSVLAHYDVCLTKRARALRLGAVAVDTEWVRARIRQVREKEGRGVTAPAGGECHT